MVRFVCIGARGGSAGRDGDGEPAPDFPAGSPGSLTAGILDRAPVPLHSPPAVQVAQAAGASGTAGSAPAAEGEGEGQSLAEVNRQLSNPISRYWALTMQFNNYQLANHQQCWSIGGSTDRPFTSQMNLLPFAAWFFAPGWSLGYSGSILANWRAPAKHVWTIPLGLALGKVVKLGPLPVKFSLAGQYMVVRPSNTGQEGNIQVQITPVLPKLIQDTLFE